MLPQHNPARFEVFTPLPKGFKIPNGDRFIYDEHGGWADVDGCYYDKDCNPAGWIQLYKDRYSKYDMNYKFVEEGINKYYGRHKLTIKEARELLIEEMFLQNRRTLKEFQIDAYNKKFQTQRQSKLRKYWSFVIHYRVAVRNFKYEDLHRMLSQITQHYEIQDGRIISRLNIRNELLRILQQNPLIRILD